MSPGLNPVLNDPGVIPTDDILFSIVGEQISLWNTLIKTVRESDKEVSGSWNYYKDGKQWLFKLVRKKKTLFWAGIFDNTFRITFYFGDKAEPVIIGSDLPERLINGFRNAKRFGSIRPISVILTEHSDAEDVYKLVKLKNQIK